MISDHIYTFLTSKTAITSLVGSRIYPMILPAQPTYPAITYREEDTDYIETFEGIAAPVSSSYFFDAWGSTYAQAVSVSDAIRSALNNISGPFGGISINKCVIESGPNSFYEDTVEAYRLTQVFVISHKEGI